MMEKNAQEAYLVYDENDEGIDVEEGEEKIFPCPVCGTVAFPYKGSWDFCPRCHWQDDVYQEQYPDEEDCANKMSLNQARAAYRAGKPIY